ncbi:MAG: hypothetical protein IJB34_01750 [Clostridia bacterium]|nr:hypothetical protein [Clostridia bacterium]
MKNKGRNAMTQGALLTGSMRCPNPACGKEFDEPIELFDGKLVCPHCAKELNKRTFVVNVDNDNKFRLSQTYYGTYLAEAAQGSATNKKTAEKHERYLANALWFCREAARSGHPEARIMLGFYWEMGYMNKGSDLDRYKMACHYYSDVCYSEQETMEVEIPEGEDGFGEYQKDGKEKLAKLKREAAVRLLRMLAGAPAELDAIKRGSDYPYSYFEHAKNLKHLVGDREMKKAALPSKGSHGELVYKTLMACANREDHVPVFGYFILKQSEFIALYEGDGKGHSLKNIATKHGQNLFIYYAEMQDGHVMLGETFAAVSNRALKFDYEDAEEDICLYFYNKKPQISKSVAKVKKLIQKRLYDSLIDSRNVKNSSGLIELMNSESPAVEHLFYPEDVYFAWLKMKAEKKKNPIVALASYLGSEDDDEK